MGRELNQLSALDEKDNKVYPTWDAIVERLGTKDTSLLIWCMEQWPPYLAVSVTIVYLYAFTHICKFLFK